MSKIVERIKEYMDFRQISIAAFEKSIGLSNASFNKTLKTGGAIGTDKLEKILSAYPELNPHWLMTGEEPMVIPSGAYGRIYKILQREGLSEKDFARGSGSIGFICPDIYKNAQKNPADPKVLEDWTNALLKRFPQYSREWIMYGTGEMLLSNNIKPDQTFTLRTDRKVQVQDIPLYDLSATAGIMAIFNDVSITPEDYLRVPNLPPVDGAIYVRGESMTPLLKSGDIIIFKKLELSLDSILWGQIYLLSFDAGGDTFTVVKYIQKSDDPGFIRLVSQNSHFEPKDIPLSSIRALAIVKASITFHTIE